MKTFRNSIIFIIIIALVGGVAYFAFFKKDTTNTTNLTTTSVVDVQNTSTDTTNELSQQFLASLSKIKNITLATSFFENSVYKSLQDYTQSIVLQDSSLIGRANPFAPLDSDLINITTPAVDTTIQNNTTPSTTPPAALPTTKTTKKK